MRYLSGTKDYYLKLAATQLTRLVVTTDADWANDKSNRKSVSGHIVYLFGCPVHWSSSQQGIVALSSTAAEIIAASEGETQSEWIKLMVDSVLKVDESVPPPLCLQMDCKSAIQGVKRDGSSDAQKAVDVRFHAVKDAFKSGLLTLSYLPTSIMPADIPTKSLVPKECDTNLLLCCVTPPSRSSFDT
ncbi:hypothetical protein PF010_g5616 [Phytophthora fragariae]|uniref:Reverse transcriptase Ty1/copia-type domain-containing protein n=1 Tax=Phytophthora fragariae TaxID=53985 RepID=A0A6G0LNN0_9STRA|nr:hypothetical protein PF010_g5616 [Phytophthora fragariae]KAE9243602.1 hypothetical protein PF004_g6056 [Phytophthora fragariae]